MVMSWKFYSKQIFHERKVKTTCYHPLLLRIYIYTLYVLANPKALYALSTNQDPKDFILSKESCYAVLQFQVYIGRISSK